MGTVDRGGGRLTLRRRVEQVLWDAAANVLAGAVIGSWALALGLFNATTSQRSSAQRLLGLLAAGFALVIMGLAGAELLHGGRSALVGRLRPAGRSLLKFYGRLPWWLTIFVLYGVAFLLWFIFTRVDWLSNPWIDAVLIVLAGGACLKSIVSIRRLHDRLRAEARLREAEAEALSRDVGAAG